MERMVEIVSAEMETLTAFIRRRAGTGSMVGITGSWIRWTVGMEEILGREGEESDPRRLGLKSSCSGSNVLKREGGKFDL